jgi:hypothetical protein
MLRMSMGVLLGVLSFLVYMFVFESAGLLSAFIAVATFLFVCQFLLSRGHADAHRRDWRVMLALAAPLLAVVLIMVVVERREAILAQGSVILLACAGIYAGAAVASLAARRSVARSH